MSHEPTIRPATPRDLPALVDAADRVFRAAPRAGSMGRDYPALFAAENAHNLMLAEIEGRIVGHAGFVPRRLVTPARTALVACVGAVFTAEELRGRGLGGRLLGAALARAQVAGAEAALASGAGPLYDRAGFVRLSPFLRVRVPAADPPVGIHVRPFTGADLDDVMAAHDGRAVRFERARADWQRWLAAGVALYDPGRLFVVADGARVVAFIAIAHRPDGSARAIEVAGPTAPLVAGLAAAAGLLGVGELPVVLGPDQDALAVAVTARGGVREEAPFPWSALSWSRGPALALPFFGIDYV